MSWPYAVRERFKADLAKLLGLYGGASIEVHRYGFGGAEVSVQNEAGDVLIAFRQIKADNPNPAFWIVKGSGRYHGGEVFLYDAELKSGLKMGGDKEQAHRFESRAEAERAAAFLNVAGTAYQYLWAVL